MAGVLLRLQLRHCPLQVGGWRGGKIRVDYDSDNTVGLNKGFILCTYVCVCVRARITQQCQLVDAGADVLSQSSGVLWSASLVGHDGDL